MNKKRHILIITAWYKTPEKPTYANFVEEQARMLPRSGPTESVMHPYFNGTYKDSFSGNTAKSWNETDDGIYTMRVGCSVWIPRVKQWYYQQLCKKAQQTFETYISQFGKPDVIYSHAMFMGGIIASDLAVKYNLPHCHIEHTSGLIFHPKQYTQSDIRHVQQVYSQANHTFFVSRYALEEIQKIHQLHIHNAVVMPNVVSPIFFETSNSKAQEQNRVAIAIGSLIPRKRFDLIIAAWKLVLVDFPNAKLLLVGSGALEQQLKDQAQALGIAQQIAWIPSLNRVEIKENIDQSQLMLSASQVETFGLTMAEALACGKPIVATNSGGPQDFIDAENGILVEEATPQKMAEAISYVFTNIHQYQASVIKQKCYDAFSERTVVAKLEKVFSGICD